MLVTVSDERPVRGTSIDCYGNTTCCCLSGRADAIRRPPHIESGGDLDALLHGYLCHERLAAASRCAAVLRAAHCPEAAPGPRATRRPFEPYDSVHRLRSRICLAQGSREERGRDD